MNRKIRSGHTPFPKDTRPIIPRFNVRKPRFSPGNITRKTGPEPFVSLRHADGAGGAGFWEGMGGLAPPTICITRRWSPFHVAVIAACVELPPVLCIWFPTPDTWLIVPDPACIPIALEVRVAAPLATEPLPCTGLVDSVSPKVCRAVELPAVLLTVMSLMSRVP